MKKRVFVLVLVAALIVTMMAGCAGGTASQTSAATTAASTTAASTAATTATSSAASATATTAVATTAASGATDSENFNETGYPIVKEPITVRAVFFESPDNNGKPEDMDQYKRLTEVTNVIFDWTFMDPSAEIKNLHFASGDLADFYNGALTSDIINMYGVEGGLFQDISKLIYQYMPNMVARFEEYPQAEKAIYEIDGAVYTLPWVMLGTTAADGRMFYRSDMLEDLGIETPKTTTEFYDACKTILDSGITQGYSPILPGNGDGVGGYLMTYLFNAFGDSVDKEFADDGTGKVVYNYISDQYQRCIEYIRLLYADKLLENEIYSLDADTVNARARAGQAAFVQNSGIYTSEDFADGIFHIDVIPPLTSEWNSTAKIKGYDCVSAVSGGINKDCEYVREILRYCDIAYAKDEVMIGTGLNALAFNMGIKDEHYKVNAEDNTYEFILPDGYDGNAYTYLRLHYCWHYDFGIYDNFYFNKAPLNNAREKGMYYNNILYAVDPFPKGLLKMTEDESYSIASRYSDISNYVSQMQAKFVTGVEPLDNWDQYVKEVNNMGIDQVLTVYQTAYDRWNSN
ncbi:MAG: extracellular solute-binding protein [Clostridiaceae bacterium]|nr:extracellular solute-binding protein [Clostridiaceae bacterium]